jgi:hypothetical protein
LSPSITPRRAAFAAAAMLSLGGASTAHAATPHIRLLKTPATTSARVVRFAAPTDDALITSNVVPVTIKAGPQVTGVKVFAGTKDVSAHFTRSGSAFTAKLPRSLLTTGTNTLLVQAETSDHKAGGASRVSVVVPQAAPDLMTVSDGRAAAAASAKDPAADPGYLPSDAGQISVAIHTKSPTFAKLTVNGHHVADLRAGVRLEDHHWLISAEDGLKVGTNQLAVDSWDKEGRHSVKRWTVHRSAALPLTEAGPNERVVKPSAWVRLNGSKTKATRKGARITYKWRVVRAPNGAKPQLQNANTATPQFKPDRPGVYQLALTATQDGRSSSEDVTTVDAVPPITPEGQFISTAMSNMGGGRWAINIDGQDWVNSQTAPKPDVRVQLDEATLAVTASGDHTQITPKPGTITIGTWENTPGITNDTYGSEIWIGTQQVAYTGNSTAPANDAAAPHLNGWIKPAATAGADDATWVDSDMMQVKTRLPSDTATTNTMEINGVQHHTSLPAGAIGGYHLIELDNNGAAKWQYLYPMTGNGSTDAPELSKLAFDIGNSSPNTTFLLQGFGKLAAIDPTSDLGAKLQSIGGRADVASRFNGTTDSTGGVYALISGRSQTDHNTWSSYAADEASYERTKTASESGLLVRDAYSNDYIPLTADSSAPDPAGSSRYGIMTTAYAAPSSWANWIRDDDGSLRAPTAAETSAWNSLYKQVLAHNWVPKTPLCSGAPDLIRAYYCKTDANALQTLMDRISGQLHFNSTTANGAYDEQDWDNVAYSIEDEIGDVSNIRSAIADYQGLFGTASIDGAVNAPAIGDAVKAAIQKSSQTPTNASMENMLGAITSMESAAFPEVGGPLTFLSSAFSLMADEEPDSNVDDVLANQQVTQDTAATTLVAAYQNASTELSRYGDYLVTDPVKLQQGAQFLMNNDPQTTDANSDFVHAAEYATEQWLWGTDLSTAYSEFVWPDSLGWSPSCSVNGYVGDPFFSFTQNTSGQWKSTEEPNAGWWPNVGINSPASRWHLGLDWDTADPTRTDSYAAGYDVGTVPTLKDVSIPSSITDPLFNPAVSATQAPSASAPAGAVMPYFALNYLEFKRPAVSDVSTWGTNKVFQNEPNCEPHDGMPVTD